MSNKCPKYADGIHRLCVVHRDGKEYSACKRCEWTSKEPLEIDPPQEKMTETPRTDRRYQYDEIRNMVEGAVFYGLGDEAYELWTSMCGTCYQMAGLASMERASLLADWIVQDAIGSAEFWRENCENFLGVPFEEVEHANGVWSYQGR